MWKLTKWYEKTVYVIGWIMVALWAMYLVFILAFTAGGGYNT